MLVSVIYCRRAPPGKFGLARFANAQTFGALKVQGFSKLTAPFHNAQAFGALAVMIPGALVLPTTPFANVNGFGALTVQAPPELEITAFGEADIFGALTLLDTGTSGGNPPTGGASHSGNYTLVAGDANQEVNFDIPGSSSSVNYALTVPTNASVPFLVGTIIWITVKLEINTGFGASSLSVVGAGGVTVRGKTLLCSTGALSSANNGAMLVKEATDTWIVV
jgi:hypothetical protein